MRHADHFGGPPHHTLARLLHVLWWVLAALAAVLFFFPAPVSGQEYAGSEVCGACHEDIAKAFQKNKHFAVETDKKRGWETRACESCHGPGAKHAESASAADILQPAKAKPAQADRRCLGCHQNTMTQAGRIQGSHGRNQVACVTCHPVHAAPAPARPSASAIVTRESKINSQCASCHVSTWAEFQRPNRHTLPEGTMSCVDCHNPHGTHLPKMTRASGSNEPGCFNCHGDKRGPFAFEHAPVRLEGCRACHEPHGSANPRMLKRAEERFVCLECHANIGAARPALGGVPPALHDLRNPRFRECSVCHVKIHGSHVNRSLFR